MKVSILTSVITTILVNLIWNSPLFFLLAILAVWVWMGIKAHQIDDSAPLMGCLLFAPICFVIVCSIHGWDEAFPWIKKIKFQSPVKFKKEES